MIEIVLAEDHHLVREGLRSVLESDPGFHVVAETGDGLQVISLIEEHEPDILILDLLLPGLHGLEILRRIAGLDSRTRTVVVSMHEHELYVRQSIRLGAGGYVVKHSPTHVLRTAIRSVLSGSRYVDPAVPQEALDEGENVQDDAALDPYGFLTEREREVLQLVVEGLTMKETGERLSISPRTVEKHRASLMKKLGVENQSELVRYAVYRGLLGPPPSRSDGDGDDPRTPGEHGDE